MIKKGLGKGLGALIASEDSEEAGIKELKLNEIEPNINQPRKMFDDDKLIQLSESIKQHGIVQPIIVKKEDDIYRIVAGERRWRAARLAGLITVPVIIKELSNKQVMEIALIENLQREDLNPIEEAEAFEKLINDYNMTQEEISVVVGKSRPAIANSLRLLALTDKVKEYVVNGDLTSGHARAMTIIEDNQLQEKVAMQVIQNKLNVRETEKLVKNILFKKPVKKISVKNEEIYSIEDKLKGIFGTKVELVTNKKRGKIMIEYYSNDELERLLDLFNMIGEK